MRSRHNVSRTERTVEALERMDVRPAGADPVITARFLAGGVLGVVGACCPARLGSRRYGLPWNDTSQAFIPIK